MHLAINNWLFVNVNKKDGRLTGSTLLSSLSLLVHIVLIISTIVIVAAFTRPLSLGIWMPTNSFFKECCLATPHLIFLWWISGENETHLWPKSSQVCVCLKGGVRFCRNQTLRMILTEAAAVFPGGQRSRARPAVLATLWPKVHNGGPVPDRWVAPASLHLNTCIMPWVCVGEQVLLRYDYIWEKWRFLLLRYFMCTQQHFVYLYSYEDLSNP